MKKRWREKTEHFACEIEILIKKQCQLQRAPQLRGKIHFPLGKSKVSDLLCVRVLLLSMCLAFVYVLFGSHFFHLSYFCCCCCCCCFWCDSLERALFVPLSQQFTRYCNIELCILNNLVKMLLLLVVVAAATVVIFFLLFLYHFHKCRLIKTYLIMNEQTNEEKKKLGPTMQQCTTPTKWTQYTKQNAWELWNSYEMLAFFYTVFIALSSLIITTTANKTSSHFLFAVCLLILFFFHFHLIVENLTWWFAFYFSCR